MGIYFEESRCYTESKTIIELWTFLQNALHGVGRKEEGTQRSCADIARRDREMAEADTSGRSEEKMEEQKPEKKTSLLRKLDEKKKECAERDAKKQAVKKKRNHEISL